jgi:hypothetical protein
MRSSSGALRVQSGCGAAPCAAGELEKRIAEAGQQGNGKIARSYVDFRRLR